MNDQNEYTPSFEQLLALLAMRTGELIESTNALREAVEELTAALEE